MRPAHEGLIQEPDPQAATGGAGSMALMGAREVLLIRGGRVATNAETASANLLGGWISSSSARSVA
jgi:hypothetical protein